MATRAAKSNRLRRPAVRSRARVVREPVIPRLQPMLPSRTIFTRIPGYDALTQSWPVRGFRETGAGHLAAILAFNGMVALVPTFLLNVSVAGYLLRKDAVLTSAVHTLYWALPSEDARQALEVALTARHQSGLLAVISLFAFLWIGSGFAGALNHCLNQVYGAPDCGFICARRRGLMVILGSAGLFTVATTAATVPTLFLARNLGPYFQTWSLANGRTQVLSYGLGFVAASALFLFIYRVAPTAGQRTCDVWPGSLVAAGLFVALGQVFPIYLRIAGGANRFGAAFALVTLLVGWFAALAHVTLFGSYVNATYKRRRAAAR